MIKLLLITSAVAMAPRASRPKKIRGVREDRWSFDVLTKWKKDGEHAQIVATDARGEVGWFEVLRSRGGNVPRPLAVLGPRVSTAPPAPSTCRPSGTVRFNLTSPSYPGSAMGIVRSASLP